MPRHADHDHDHDDDYDDRRKVPSFGSGFVEYDKHGIRFQFPGDWELTEQTIDRETTISLQSEGTSFWTVMLFRERPAVDTVLETVVAAIKQEYDEVDVVSTVESLSGMPSLGRNLDFVCFDLVNSAIISAFQTSDLTVMVLYQGTDHELQTTREQLESITRSLRCEDDVDDAFAVE